MPAQGGNDSRWINHSCDPNCETNEEDNRIFVYALRAIRPGEELFYDYQIVPAERRTKKLEKEFACSLRQREMPRHDDGTARASLDPKKDAERKTPDDSVQSGR